MSQLVFPSLPGMKIEVDREPYFATQVQETISGRELRSTWWTYPRYRYRLAFEILNATKGDFQTLFGYLAKHFGALDSFLWTDPQDNAVTDHGFGLGDGTTTAYQLQRTLAGSVTDASGATYTQATKPYTNLLFNSSFETDTNADGIADSWTVRNTESATVPSTATIVPGMNGGKAQRISWGTNAAAQHGINAAIAPGYLPGQWYTLSGFARASGTNIGKTLSVLFDVPLPNTIVTIQNPPLASAWQRFVVQIFWNIGTAPVSTFNAVLSATASFGTLDFDLVQVTKGQWGANDLQPIETPATATATDNPQLWPAVVDGFEPIFDLAAPPTIYLDGDWQGRRALYPYPRTNILPASEDLSLWVNGHIALTLNTGTAPDGTASADLVSEGAPPGTPTLNSATPSTTGGTLAAGTYFLKVSALSADVVPEGLPSAELSATTTGTTGSIALAWTAVTGATGYRVYVGAVAGAESSYFLPGNVTSYTLTSSSGTAGTPVTSTAFVHSINRNTSPTDVQGDLRCYSVWLKAGATPLTNIMWRAQSSDGGINFNLGTGAIDGTRVATGGAATLASGVIAYQNGWYRIWFTQRSGTTLNTGVILQGAVDNTYVNSTYVGTGRSFYGWGAMVERVADLNGPNPYIKTPTTVPVTAPADYSVGSTGIVTLTAAPAAGTWLTWDGSYYRRVRFAQDNLSASRLAASMWAAKAVELVSVK